MLALHLEKDGYVPATMYCLRSPVPVQKLPDQFQSHQVINSGLRCAAIMAISPFPYRYQANVVMGYISPGYQRDFHRADFHGTSFLLPDGELFEWK